MQSYYGSSAAAKRFEVTLCECELQLPEGVVRAWNGEVLRWGRGQQQEESFRGAALVDLPDGMKIRRTRSHQHSLADAASQKRYAVPRSYSVPRSADVFRRR